MKGVGMSARNATGATKYVFAGMASEDELTTKVCPRCGEVLFADMDVCYGCLYDFRKEGGAGRSGGGVGEQAQGMVHGGSVLPMRMGAPSTAQLPDPLQDIELDEVDDEFDELGVSDADITACPRHSKRYDDPADDTVDLSAASGAGEPAPPPRRFKIIADSQDMRVRIPLTERGLSVGRGASNDIVLKSSSVSRRHLKLVVSDGEVIVEDCGATNPAIEHGKPLEGSVRLRAGELVTVCGTTLEVDEDLPDPAA